MARPRLLLIITLAEVGGAQAYVMSLLPTLVEHFAVTVAASGSGPLIDAARIAGADYVALRFVRRDVSWREPLGVLELVRICRRLRPHIVHANSSKAGVLGRLAAWFAGVPVRIFTVHGWAFMQYGGVMARVYLGLDRLVRPLTTRFICVSETTRAAGLAARTCTTAQAIVIPNGVDLTKPRSPLAGTPPRVLAVGRLKEPKDFLTLLTALARVEEPYRAAVIGDGPDRRALEEPARDAHVELLGERSDVPEQLAASDVFALASNSEGLPISILEAMAAGLPVVASRVGGVPELVVDGETGLLVPPGDVVALAAALRLLLSDAALRRRLGSAGRRRAEERFGLDAFRDAHLRLYREELAARGLSFPAP